MNIRTCAALLLAAGLPTAAFAVNFPEIEPNDSKAQALANGVFTLSPGDTITGNTTGTSTLTAGAASADTYRVRVDHPSSGIYRHRLVITTAGTAGHSGTIRGLTVTAGVPNATSDAALQTSSTLTTPARMNQWYGMGTGSDIYYRVTGTASTTADYVSTLESAPVTVTPFGVNPEEGTMRIFPDAATDGAYDTLTYLYDSNFNPIAGWDDPDSTGITATLAPGTYYYSISRFNGYAGQFPRTATSSVLDFANAALGGSATSTGTLPATIVIDDITSNVISATGDIIGGYDMAWFTFTVVPSVTPTNPAGVGSANPSAVINDGTGVTTLSVTVTPGTNPVSTFLTTGTVTVDGSGIGAGTVTLLDDGVAPDLVAGDLIFTADATVANGTAGGAYTLPFTITDDQARIGTGNIALTVTTPPPGCSAGLATLAFSNVSSNGAVGDASNSIVTGDFGVAGQINQFVISGRVAAFGPSFRSEASVRATAPDGSIYSFAFGLPASAGTSDVIDFPVTFAPESGTGTWTFEFFESFADGAVNPDATWQAICFAANVVSTPITATDTASGPVVRDGVATSTLSVTVTPGAVPDSTGLAVVVDASSVGGSGSLALLDDGNAPDALAGDNIFTGTTTVAYTTALGTATLPFTVTDNEARSFNGELNFTVSEATGACCLGDGSCIVTTIGDCLDVQGGTFAGTGTACIAPTALSTDGAGAFEDISATGTLLATLAGADDAGEVVALPFTFNFFGNDYTSIRVVTNGFAQFTGTSTAFSNGPIPSAAVPNDALYPLWDDHDFDVSGAAYTQLLGTLGSDARFIIQWNNAGQYNTGLTPTDTNTFQVALFEDGSFEFRYANVALETTVDTTTIGFENADGTIAFQSAETRETLNAAVPISFRANSTLGDTGVCGNGCPPCAADYDNNGGVDGGDLGAFFADFEAGETCADVDGNGGVDGGDLGFFFAVFEAGGC
jgi:hypothetical protein